MVKGAVITPDGKYRYLLWRYWKPVEERKVLTFVMLNPSVADGETDDPTIRKCVGFADRLGYSGIEVLNIFAMRATDPEVLVSAAFDRVGPDNYKYFAEKIPGAEIVAAWGAWGKHKHLIGAVDKARLLIKKLDPKSVRCFGRTECWNPRHPLMLSYKTPLEDFRL